MDLITSRTPRSNLAGGKENKSGCIERTRGMSPYPSTVLKWPNSRATQSDCVAWFSDLGYPIGPIIAATQRSLEVSCDSCLRPG
jgi:hypothetical protein